MLLNEYRIPALLKQRVRPVFATSVTAPDTPALYPYKVVQMGLERRAGAEGQLSMY